MLSNKMKAVVIVGGYFGVLTLGALLGWAPYADAQTIVVSQYCTETPEISQGFKINNYSSNYGPTIFRWERKANFQIVETGSGQVTGNSETTFTTGRNSEKDMWKIEWTDGQFTNWQSPGVAQFGDAGCAKATVAPVVTPTPAPSPAPAPQLPRVEIAGRSYEVEENPTTLLSLRIKLIWLMEQLFDLEY